jgi:putative Mg2+ transporter-C (MgtC) family protein
MIDPGFLPWPEMLGRLGAAFLVGALIGFERERHQRPAGLRTHILVSMASALFAMLSVLVAGEHNDPGRIAAQVVTGIGFLGAGTIMRHGSTIRGLTTAASLWMAAALGLAAGFGWYLGAGATALLALLVLTVVKLIEDRLPHPGPTATLLIHARPGRDALPEVLAAIRRFGGLVARVEFGAETAAEGQTYTIAFNPAPGMDLHVTVAALDALEGIDHAGPSDGRGE